MTKVRQQFSQILMANFKQISHILSFSENQVLEAIMQLYLVLGSNLGVELIIDYDIKETRTPLFKIYNS